MKKLFVLFVCFFAAIHANNPQYDFNVVFDEIEYKNVPSKYDIHPRRTSELEILDNPPKERDVRGIHAIVNDYADKVFEHVRDLIIHQGLDPTEMPDLHTGFNYTLILTFHGELDLTEGWLQDLSTIHRGGDVEVDYSTDTKYLEVTVPMAFDDLQFTYNYAAKIMDLGPTGGIEGKISNLGIRVKIGFDCNNFVASLDEFYITDSGHIDFKFTGNALVDWLLNLLSDIVTTLLKEVILLVVEGVVRGGLDAIIQTINDLIGGILNPTTPAPAVSPAQLYLN